MSLKAMADSVRAEQRRRAQAAPAARRKNNIEVARQWKERKRRAWERSRSIFEGAFNRQFSPHRFYYETGYNRGQYVKVSINYEGKLWAFVKVFNEEGARYLYVHPIGVPEDEAKQLPIPSNKADLYDRVAALVAEWELA